MSYAQAMRWQKKHPTGGKPQYMGFDAFSSSGPIKPREVILKRIAGSLVWIPIERMSVADACEKHPDAIRFSNPLPHEEFKCNGPAWKPEDGKANPLRRSTLVFP